MLLYFACTCKIRNEWNQMEALTQNGLCCVDVTARYNP